MIISRARSYVFVHIPKTGGTSLAQALETRAARDDILIGDTPKALLRKKRIAALTPQGRLWKHSTLADIDGVLSMQELAGMFTFTLVRNPFDRVVSYYEWLRAQRFDHPSVVLAHRVDFGSFLADHQTQKSLKEAPAASYMLRADGVTQCSAYIRLEHFERDAAVLWSHLGFELGIPHLNASKRAPDYRDYYTASARDIVKSVCAADLVQFDYRFD